MRESPGDGGPDLHEKPLATNLHTFHYDSLARVLTVYWLWTRRDPSGAQGRDDMVNTDTVQYLTFYQMDSC